ncbi:MAG: hypothetical protein NC925_02765 [Candidatus Omnitrophica bacterium]|nr:hypothetical protein [Candidatus Omnitrophota bacterium]MCM8831231.1 hypothetical protein [Candidatus Omnitrophota bacterium]
MVYEDLNLYVATNLKINIEFIIIYGILLLKYTYAFYRFLRIERRRVL